MGNQIKSFRQIIIFSVILLLAGFIRLWGAWRGDFAYTYDVGRDLLAVRSLVVDQKLTLLGPTTGIAGVFYGPWWYYFLAIPFLIFQGNPVGIAFFMGLVGMIIVFLGFVLGKLIFGVKNQAWPLILASLLAFSSSHAEMSTQIWSPNLAPLFIMLWFLFFLAFLKSQKLAFFWLGFFSALILESEVAFGIFFILAEIFALIACFRKEVSFKKALLFFLGLLVIFSPRILFETRHNFLVTRNALNFLREKGLAVGGDGNLLGRSQERLMAFISVWHNALARGNSFLGLVLLILGIASFFFLRKNSSKTEKRIVNFLILLILGLYLLFSFYGGDFWWYYLIGLPTIYTLLFIFLLHRLYQVIPRKVFWLGLIFYLVFTAQPAKIFMTLRQPGWEGDAAVYRNVKAVVEGVFQDADGEPFSCVVYTPPMTPYAYQYLFTWLSEKKYHNLPRPENELVYFIIEPNAYDPDRQRDWLLAHGGDGKIVFEKKVKGGITLQKRRRE